MLSKEFSPLEKEFFRNVTYIPLNIPNNFKLNMGSMTELYISLALKESEILSPDKAINTYAKISTLVGRSRTLALGLESMCSRILKP